MIRPFFFALACAGTAQAQPLFTDRAANLPGSPHVYDGGWAHFVGGGVAVFDCNGDGLPEFLPAGGDNPAPLYLNTSAPGGALRFFLAETQPLDGVTGTTGAYPLDMDGDGVLDLFILRVGPNVALKGLGDCRFEDATTAWGLPGTDRWSTAFSATWEPGQTRPTLAIGNYVDRTDPDGPFEACDQNTLLRPGADGYEPEIALEPGFCALSALFSDWARTGRADLRLSNDRHYYVRGGSEQMWSMEPLRLLGAEDGWRNVSLWGMGIASRDLNGDARPDVMLTSMGDQLLQFSDGATGFRDAPYAQGSYATRPHLGDDGRPSTGWHAQFGDVDNDGYADLFIAKGNVEQMPGNAMRDPNNLLMQQPDGTFTEASVEAGIATLERARGAALADLNADGLLDLIVVNRRDPLELWQNVTESTGNWLSVDLRQDGGNAFAVGAWIELRSGGHIQRQELTVGGGHAGGQALPLHFGLGDALSAEIRVQWPDGTTTDWQEVPANQPLTLRR